MRDSEAERLLDQLTLTQRALDSTQDALKRCKERQSMLLLEINTLGDENKVLTDIARSVLNGGGCVGRRVIDKIKSALGEGMA